MKEMIFLGVGGRISVLNSERMLTYCPSTLSSIKMISECIFKIGSGNKTYHFVKLKMNRKERYSYSKKSYSLELEFEDGGYGGHIVFQNGANLESNYAQVVSYHCV